MSDVLKPCFSIQEALRMRKYIFFILILISGSNVLAEVSSSFTILVGNANQRLSYSGYEPVSADDKSVGMRFSHDFGSRIGIEMTYHDFGDASKSEVEFIEVWTDTLSSSAIELGVKSTIPINDTFAFDGRVGLAKWDTSSRSVGSFFPEDVFEWRDNGVDIYYGMGLKTKITEVIGLGLEYSVNKMALDVDSYKGDFDVKNLSLVFEFYFKD